MSEPDELRRLIRVGDRYEYVADGAVLKYAAEPHVGAEQVPVAILRVLEG